MQLVARRNFSHLEDFLLIVAIATSFFFVVHLLHWSHYGIDFTDESFYLNSISDPWMYRASATQFGYIYHLLYQLVGRDIVLLRQANILIITGLACTLSAVLLKHLVDTARQAVHLPAYHLYGLAFILSTSSLALFDLWLLTPSYNSLALQSVLIAAIGIVIAEKNVSTRSVAGWLLIGLAGWLAIMAKPTTGAFLGIAVLIYLVLARKLSLRLLSLSILTAVALFCISAWVIDGSVHLFINRFIEGSEDGKRLLGKFLFSSVFRLDDFVLNTKETLTLRRIAALTFLATWLSIHWRNWTSFIWAISIVLLIVASILFGLNYFGPVFSYSGFQGMLMTAASAGAIAATAFNFQKTSAKSFFSYLALALFLASMPYAYAFGTGNNYWKTETKAAIFWVLGTIVFIHALRPSIISWRALAPLALGSQLVAIVLVNMSMEYPYRQSQPLRLNADAVDMPHVDNKLMVSREFVDYIQNVRKIATANGFKPRDPIIDLTGHYPGTLYFLDAKPIGLPWMIGGYPGSEKFVKAALDRTSCDDLAKAWVLIERDGPRKLPLEILVKFGIDPDKDLQTVGSIASPKVDYPHSFQQELMRPLRNFEAAKANCEHKRNGSIAE